MVSNEKSAKTARNTNTTHQLKSLSDEKYINHVKSYQWFQKHVNRKYNHCINLPERLGYVCNPRSLMEERRRYVVTT